MFIEVNRDEAKEIEEYLKRQQIQYVISEAYGLMHIEFGPLTAEQKEVINQIHEAGRNNRLKKVTVSDRKTKTPKQALMDYVKGKTQQEEYVYERD